jgi:GH18 family chitinase/lysophospholipase L1-like esterase
MPVVKSRRGLFRIALALTVLILAAPLLWTQLYPHNDWGRRSEASSLSGKSTAESDATGNPREVSKTDNWVTGYYAAWQVGLYPIDRIDFTAITHIALAHWLTAADGTLQPSAMDTLGPSIVSAAHHSARKVIMMLGGSDDSHFVTAANPTNRATLVNSILKKIDSLNLDGVDLDWETNIDNPDFAALARDLRQARPDLIITVPIDASLGGSARLASALAPYCDQLNMMTYGGGGSYPGWVSWYFSALAGDGLDHPSSVNLFVNKWRKAGVPAAKIGVGLGFYGQGWSTPVRGPLQFSGTASVPLKDLPYGASLTNGGSVLSWFYNQPGATYMYDAGLPQQPSITIPSGLTPPGWSGPPITWVTYEDEGSVTAKAAYVKANGLGGVIIWTLNQGATDPTTGRNPLLDSVKRAFLNQGPAAMPFLGTATAYVGGPANLTVTGTLTRVAAVWRGGGTSFDENVYHDTSYGRPSEYYIEASSGGSTWTSLRHVSHNSYNGGQFLFDISGHSYTQLRMRIKSIVGPYAGRVVLDVHDGSAGSVDSYLFLGDSLTSDCWGASDFPREALGPGIHAQRPKQHPIFSVGGTPSLLSSSALSTAPYNTPVIRHWLQDFAPAKYVALSFGVNDANGNVPAATYCSNMQALVQEVIAAGKTPIIPTIIASPSVNVRAHAPAMNACLAKLRMKYPSIIAGPDLWTLFYGHSVSDGWFADSLHPSLTTGCTALKNAWIETVVASIYPQ